MPKFNLRDYCRKKLPCQYRIKDEVTEEVVVLRGLPLKTTPEALADHGEEYGIKAVKFPEESVDGTKSGKGTAGACSGEVARELLEGWLAPQEEVTPIIKPKQEAPANGNRVTVPAK